MKRQKRVLKEPLNQEGMEEWATATNNFLAKRRRISVAETERKQISEG